MTTALDFETEYSKEFGLANLGVAEYTRRLTADQIYYLTVVSDTGFKWGGDPKRAPQEVWDCLRDSETLVAHNQNFDGRVLDQLIKLGRAPDIDHWSRLNCTADLAAFFGVGRRLEAAAKNALGKAVNKEVRAQMLGKKYEDLPDHKRTALEEYAMKDSELCLGLWQKLSPKWTEKERAISRHTRDMARRGVPIDADYARKQLEVALSVRKSAAELIPWTEQGYALNSPAAVKRECERLKLPPPQTTRADSEEWKEWLDEHGITAPWGPALNLWRKANRLVTWLEKVIARTHGGRMQFGMLYFGSTTGRFAGSDGLNLININRADVEGVDLRGCLAPAEGKTLVVADLAQIEARCAFWIAGMKDILSDVSQGQSIYEAYAVRTGMYSGPSPMKEHDPEAYHLCKALVLSLNFQAGPARYRSMQLATGRSISLADAKKEVYGYRDSLPRLVSLWKSLERWIDKSCGKNIVKLPLDSGRSLYYHHPHRDHEENQNFVIRHRHTKASRERMFPGKLLENCTQATARDVLVEAVLDAEKAGLRPVLHVHDEIVCEVDDADAPAAEKWFHDWTPPTWTDGLPVDWEVTSTKRYQK